MGQVLTAVPVLRWINTVLGFWSIFAGGVPAIRRSNHICFWVTFTGPFSASWDHLLAFSFLSLGSFPQPISSPKICQFPLISSGFPNIINVLPHDWAHHGYQHPIPDVECRLDYLGFHPCSECDPIKAFKDRGIDGPSYS